MHPVLLVFPLGGGLLQSFLSYISLAFPEWCTIGTNSREGIKAFSL